EYDQAKAEEKEFFDLESLRHPFHDTRILVGDADTEVSTALCGIDMETPELLLAAWLRERGRPVDLVISHHPEGTAQAALHSVMDLQADLFHQAGVPITVAEGLMASRIAEVERAIAPVNHQRAIDAARLLGLPFMCVHTAADNLVNRYLQTRLDQARPSTVGEVMEVLESIPEYRQARRLKAGPRLFVGDKKRRAGRVLVDMTGGTSGSEKMYEKLAAAGVGTVVCMHMQEKHRKNAQDHCVNVVMAGHMASDSLGLNLFLDEVEKRGVSIIPAAGFIRVRRSRDGAGELVRE
ncbi:MAG: NGG1p interacting factor NIF3, partial [Syntrophomonadaceae bacterium]|nr:NGG1p interacting factor NIF3 [Syntrophomonadaceae bacterium]